MSRSPDRWSARCAERLSRGPRADEGFSLIEVVVALGILMIVVVTLLPQLVIGLRATGTARQVTQAKGVVQAELERMRNLPYHVARDAGEFLDVLDYYYTNRTAPTVTPVCTTGGRFAPPQAGWKGYVAAGGPRCSYEPPTGAFYRTVREVPATNGTGAFTVVTSMQYLSLDTPPQPVSPPTGYDTALNSALGKPASPQVGATVTVLYTDRATLRPTTTYTQIASQPVAPNRAEASVSATSVQVGSVTPLNGPVSLSAGLLNLATALTNASTVSSSVSGVSAGLATGETGGGASRTSAAPPADPGAVLTAGAGSLLATCEVTCWGGTRVDQPALSSAQGLPTAGSASAPAQALVTDLANGGITFGNRPAASYLPGLALAPPLVRLNDPALYPALPNPAPATAQPSGLTASCAPGGTGASSFVTASGFLRTTATDAAVDPGKVEACVVARAATLSLFPTDFAPRGVVLVELRRAVARCRVSGSSHTATTDHDYEAVVRYWNGTGYAEAGTVTPSTATDPLLAIDLATTSVGDGRFLGDYIASWTALTEPGVTRSAAGGEATVKLPGVVNLVTKPVSPDPTAPTVADATSAVSIAIGAVSCSAVDAR